MYVFDSDACIELMRGKLPVARRLLERSSPRMFKIPAIVSYELRHGALKSSRPEANMFLVETFLSPFEILPFDGRCASAAARIRADLESKGMRIGPHDTLIAATAAAYEAVLITNNVREFKRVCGLRIESWKEIALD